MKNFIIPLIALASVLYSCGKAAEDRDEMDRIARRVSDSIHVGLDSALNDPVKELGGSLPSSQLPAPQPAAVQPAANTSSAAADHK